ncbi:hypothetical protein QO009_003000 [Brevibacillus aydinogluensis]|jgi:hypothetical protein|uniref:hypothetical protein n=1 Tax=Brevibacillus aydinogluensis TaxID=927786 RepID=UPI002892BA6C|nr:hypothetical protein [Brevibacillus aydinogluensis]MDT3417105.1 hypothetical protein [Brevibacillus aydinogluensis]
MKDFDFSQYEVIESNDLAMKLRHKDSQKPVIYYRHAKRHREYEDWAECNKDWKMMIE